MTKVPFADLHRQYLSLNLEIDAAIAEVIAQSAFIRGPFVERFEAEFAQMMAAQACVSCANGTDALYIAMRALGTGLGDEVVTTAHSWFSTSETIGQTGARAVFADTDGTTFTIAPAAIEAAITPRTVGIIPVHLYGQPADMPAIMAIAERHGLWVVEDCAQGHLARIDGRLVGSFGRDATWSFYPGKNLGAMGDAGAITTNDPVLADKMAAFARHGGLRKGDHLVEGINSRLDGLQAAILSVKLPHLAAWTQARRRIGARYAALLRDVPGLDLPQTAPGREHVHHLYVVRHHDRGGLATHLAAAGIATIVNYPTALPFVPAYADRGHRPEDFPNAFADQSTILSIPIFAEMRDDEICHVAEAIMAYAGRSDA